MVKIEPLSNKTLKEALDLLTKIFHPKPTDFDYPGKWLPASIKPNESKDIYKSYNTKYLKYYVAIDETSKKVVGTTGIYMLEDDEKEAAWLAWFCVNPAFRGKGIGTKLLDMIIDMARKKGKKFLRLYTTKNESEADARRLYEKKGFRVTKVEKNPDSGEDMVYMELNLKSS